MPIVRESALPALCVGDLVVPPPDWPYVAPLERLVGAKDAQRLVARAGRIGISRMTAPELVSVARISRRHAEAIVAARELVETTACPPGERISASASIIGHLPPGMATAEVEYLFAIALTVKYAVKATLLVSKGGDCTTSVGVRDVFRPLVRVGAANFVLAHNHPSGDPTPSREDALLTNALARAGRVVGIELLDHLVVATGGVVSFFDTGLMPTPAEIGA